ncbi:MAG: methyltransferase domain-containing protein [Pseudomonadota bacterium]
MSNADASVEAIAEAYYDSADADNFYTHIWGGEDIHIGIYESAQDTIRDASRRTVSRMAGLLNLSPDTAVLDIGSGYGGAARYLASTHGCKVTCLNLSRVENAKNLSMTADQGLTDNIEVVHGSFEEIPTEDGQFDVVWSQDAILHSGHRSQVLREVARVLKPGGSFLFTDPMQADDITDPSALAPIYARIHLDSLASIAFYRLTLSELGFSEVTVAPMIDQLRTHYDRVREELLARRGELAGKVSDDYIDRMVTGLGHWVDGADRGLLAWGIMHFQKN